MPLPESWEQGDSGQIQWEPHLARPDWGTLKTEEMGGAQTASTPVCGGGGGGVWWWWCVCVSVCGSGVVFQYDKNLLCIRQK